MRDWGDNRTPLMRQGALLDTPPALANAAVGAHWGASRRAGWDAPGQHTVSEKCCQRTF